MAETSQQAEKPWGWWASWGAAFLAGLAVVFVGMGLLLPSGTLAVMGFIMFAIAATWAGAAF